MRTLFTILLLTIGCLVPGAEAETNSISIYLLDRPLAEPWPNLDTAHLKDLKRISPPVLADADFVAFDTTNHTFAITSEAAKRLALSIWSLARKDAPGWGNGPYVYDTGVTALIPVPAPFVLTAFGEPIYAGAFYTLVSSASFSGVVIMAEEVFIRTNVSPHATFSFSIGLGYPAMDKGTPGSFEFGYAGKFQSDFDSSQLGYLGIFRGNLDPRDDSRIVSASRKLWAKKP